MESSGARPSRSVLRFFGPFGVCFGAQPVGKMRWEAMVRAVPSLLAVLLHEGLLYRLAIVVSHQSTKRLGMGNLLMRVGRDGPCKILMS